ncbi:hypothetical protein ACWDGI_18340 [Streptomyces sp. NPDC001220]
MREDALRGARVAVHQMVLEAPGQQMEADQRPEILVAVPADDADSVFLRAAVAHHHTAWRLTRDPVSAATLESLVYALGMAARDDVLAEIRADPGFLPAARTAAGGWLAIPAHRRTSAPR